MPKNITRDELIAAEDLMQARMPPMDPSIDGGTYTPVSFNLGFDTKSGLFVMRFVDAG